MAQWPSLARAAVDPSRLKLWLDPAFLVHPNSGLDPLRIALVGLLLLNHLALSGLSLALWRRPSCSARPQPAVGAALVALLPTRAVASGTESADRRRADAGPQCFRPAPPQPSPGRTLGTAATAGPVHSARLPLGPLGVKPPLSRHGLNSAPCCSP